MQPTTGLTKVHDDRMEDLIRRSAPGMAHWAGTGPAGMTCGKCREYGDKGRCAQFKRMMRKRGGVIPSSTPACKFFVSKR